MEETTKLQLTVTTEAAAALERYAPGTRKRGEWLSHLLENYDSKKEQEAGILERIERKLDQLTARLDVIEGKL